MEGLTDLVARLAAIDSVNPSLVPGAAGEEAAARFVAGWAHEAGLDVEWLEATPGRPSVLARAPGSGGGRTLLLCGHLDTVGVEGMAGAHAPRIEGDRLYARGAYDMKAGLAAALVAAREARGQRLAGDVVVAAVADEEHASLGIQEVLGAVRADAAVVTEPTELELVVAHKGFVWIEVEVRGRAAHGSRPDLGVDAIVAMGEVLVRLAELDVALAAREHPRLGRASVHASTIEGGTELSSYPARCILRLERRTLPGETAAAVEQEVAALLGRLDARQRTVLVRAALEVREDHELVGRLERAATVILGAPPRRAGASYWTDAAFIAAAGIPAVLFGPGGAGAHAAQEWVSLTDTEAVARTLVALARDLCA